MRFGPLAESSGSMRNTSTRAALCRMAMVLSPSSSLTFLPGSFSAPFATAHEQIVKPASKSTRSLGLMAYSPNGDIRRFGAKPRPAPTWDSRAIRSAFTDYHTAFRPYPPRTPGRGLRLRKSRVYSAFVDSSSYPAFDGKGAQHGLQADRRAPLRQGLVSSGRPGSRPVRQRADGEMGEVR